MKKFIASLLIASAFMVSCTNNSNNVVIFTSTEDFRTEHIQLLLKEQFPTYNIALQVLSTGNSAAKIKAEGTKTEADIVINLETGYLEGLQDILADLSSFDSSKFLPELVPDHHKYLPWDKSSGAIIINRSKLDSLGLPLPKSYDELLNPVYNKLVSMPNPKTSGTGYMFLVSLINAR